MTPERIVALRKTLGMCASDFARVFNVDVRSVKRWEMGQAHPVAAGEALLMALEESIKKAGPASERARSFATFAASFGLAAAMVKHLGGDV